MCKKSKSSTFYSKKIFFCTPVRDMHTKCVKHHFSSLLQFWSRYFQESRLSKIIYFPKMCEKSKSPLFYTTKIHCMHFSHVCWRYFQESRVSGMKRSRLQSPLCKSVTPLNLFVYFCFCLCFFVCSGLFFVFVC